MAHNLRKGMRRVFSNTANTIKSVGGTMTENGEQQPLLSHINHAVNSGNGHDLGKYTQSENAFVRWPARALDTTWKVLKMNPVNLLLIFVPLGIIAGIAGWNPTAIFLLNFFAIVPLAALLSFATEELSAKLGQTIGGLLNATFGNAVELIVSIVALKNGEIRIVQSSMLGSILSNTLLVLGCCFIAGGIHKSEQNFNETVASTMSSLMAVASASLIIPATLYAVMSKPESDREDNIMILSRGTAVILLILYVLYLFFQLKTHNRFFEEPKEDKPQDATSAAENGQGTLQPEPGQQTLNDAGFDVSTPQASSSNEEEPLLQPWTAGLWLVLITVLVAWCAEYLVDSIDSIVESAHISKTFIGLILLPIVGNAAEHVTAVVVSYKNKMDLAIGVSIGSSMQIALLVTPFLVILGWIIGQPMTLHFETFETVVFFVSVLIVNYLIQDGKSNYLEGCMCIGIYTIIALAFFVYPDDSVKAP